MSIRFSRKRKRLHVGFRASDWSDVWMEEKAHLDDDENPIKDNADGEMDYDLYQFSTGGREYREPRTDEVKWHPHFDPKNSDAATAAGRTKLQARFLHDAFQYLTAKTAAQARAMERDFDKPRQARWSSWFDIAKKHKRRQMPDLRDPGDDDDSDDDSAYDSDGDLPRPNGPMGPPPNRPSNTNRRRPRRDGDQNLKSKRTRLNRDGGQSRLSFNRRSSEYEMSGAIGTPPASFGRGDRTINGNESDENELFDPNPPDGVENIINGNNLDNIGSPSGERRRGNSRTNSIASSNDWGQNRKSGDNADSGRGTMGDEVDDIRRMEQYNNGIDDEEALNRAIRESMEPDG